MKLEKSSRGYLWVAALGMLLGGGVLSPTTGLAQEGALVPSLPRNELELRFELPVGASDSAESFAQSLNKVLFATFRPNDVLENGRCTLSVTELLPQPRAMYVFARLDCTLSTEALGQQVLDDAKMREIARSITERTGIEFIYPDIRPAPSIGITN